MARWTDDNGRTELHLSKEIDDILVGHADATGRNRLTNIFRLVRSVDAVQRVLAALEKVECPRAKRVGRTSRNACRIGTEPRLNFRGWDPVGPFGHAADRGDARPGHRFLAHGDAVAYRFAPRQDVVEIARVCID